MNNICLNPKFITIDFEQATILTVKLIFPNAIIKECNFHFNKCIYTRDENRTNFGRSVLQKAPSCRSLDRI